jgi:transcriptional regulator with XRE-family HTH domain
METVLIGVRKNECGNKGVMLLEFSQRLQQLRENKRVSRQVASELCGLHSDAFRRYERCESEPTLHALMAMAEYFEVSVDYLVGRCEK